MHISRRFFRPERHEPTQQLLLIDALDRQGLLTPDYRAANRKQRGISGHLIRYFVGH